MSDEMGQARHFRGVKQVVRDGGEYRLHVPLECSPELAPGNYILGYSESGGFFYLNSAPAFKLPAKVYGNPQGLVDRYLNTMRSRTKSTGVILCGHKGSGKTLTAQMLCERSGLPVVMVNRPFDGDAFRDFINDIPGDVVVLFDEFEKTYPKERQDGLLSLLDGSYQSRRLFVMTSNTDDISYWLRNRPGRIFYKRTYYALEDDVVDAYIADNLVDKSQADGLRVVLQVLDNCSMDTLCSIVEEMNRYGETAREAVDHMNVEIDGSNYDYVWSVGKADVDVELGRPHPLLDERNAHFDLYLAPDGSAFPRTTPANKGRVEGIDAYEGKGRRRWTNFMFTLTARPADFEYDPVDGVYRAAFVVDEKHPDLATSGTQPARGFRLDVRVTCRRIRVRRRGGF